MITRTVRKNPRTTRGDLVNDLQEAGTNVTQRLPSATHYDARDSDLAVPDVKGNEDETWAWVFQHDNDPSTLPGQQRSGFVRNISKSWSGLASLPISTPSKTFGGS
ncbi:hypothetical protein NFI96_016141 [Prochilodus magdalenae]|nr:hypothetical protein NFI96_016141 [Prochilodus magdalenae]